MALLTCNSLELGYDGRAVAKNISFEIEKGSYLCIVGENGSGKSTLMKTILGLIPPLSGTVSFNGVGKTDIGYLPQQTVVQKDFPAAVGEIVLTGCQGESALRPFYTAEQKRRADMSMEKMQVLNLKKRCYRELSGGQQQRVLLARALLAAKKLLVLDEPVAGLDPHATRQMYCIIKQLCDEGLTIIMVSHDIDAALSYATHILHIGKTVLFAEKQKYLESELAKRLVNERTGDEIG